MHHITETLNYRKFCARWALRQLTDPMKEHRKTIPQELLDQYHLKGDDFLQNIATGDESWVHHTTRKTKGNPRNIVIQVPRV